MAVAIHTENTRYHHPNMDRADSKELAVLKPAMRDAEDAWKRKNGMMTSFTVGAGVSQKRWNAIFGKRKAS